MKLRRTLNGGTLALLLLVSFASRAEQPTTAGEPVVIAQRYKIQSKVLNETRVYSVHKPGGYDFSDQRYPVVILLDGEGNIQHVSATVDELAKSGRAMPMLVVGIENTDRQRDLTPPITHTDPERPIEGTVGGAGNFLRFIADELLPEVDRTYRTRPARILIGHSYGGLFAVYTLLNRPDLFKAYIVASPSLGWDNQALTKQADQFAIDHKDLQAAVYMTMASEGGSMRGGAEKVVGSLAGMRGVGVEFHRWPEENHGSVVIRSVYEGMKWLNESYYIPDPVRLYEESGLAPFNKRFEMMSKYLGYEVKVPEWTLMRVQGYLVQQKRPQEALQVLQRVLELYPKSPGAHYEYGRVSLATNDRSRAEAEYKQVLALYPGHIGARSELEKLGIDPKSILAETTVPASTLRGYVGEYRYSDETTVVTFEDAKLFVKVNNEDKSELRARSNTSFFAMDSAREYIFNKKSGRVTSVSVSSPEFSYESRRVK